MFFGVGEIEGGVKLENNFKKVVRPICRTKSSFSF